MANDNLKLLGSGSFSAILLALLIGVGTGMAQERPVTTKSDPRSPAHVRVSEVTIYRDMDCFQVETPSATYVYGKKGAGFASIFDKDGRDWISYRSDGKAKGEYRGLPKCGQPTKFFHCGYGYGYGQYKTDNVFVSEVTVREADHVRIESETLDKKSACTWDFYPTHATLTLLRIDVPTFWFLYEGTPGGRLDPDKDFTLRPGGRQSTVNEPWSEVVPWVCFGAGESSVGFVCFNHQAPEKGQTDSYVSWPFEKDKDNSFQDMTVFGFGRKGHKELVKHVPDLTGLPARYSIGFVEKADLATAKTLCETIRQMPTGSERLLAQSRADSGRFLRQYWFEHGTEHGNPNSQHNKRFRVNAPEVTTHKTFAARKEARSSGLLQILAEEDLRLLAGAELYLELWGGHPGTTNRRVTLNGRTTYPISAPSGDSNCTHLYPTIRLKVTDLVNGYNALQFACDQGTTFWGHFIVEHACLRAELKDDHPDLKQAGLGDFQASVKATTKDETIDLALDVPGDALVAIATVEFRGYYTGYNENGADEAATWHGYTKGRQPVAHIGTATRAPFSAAWNVSMLPAQKDMSVRAVVHFKDLPNLVYVTPVARGLHVPERRTAKVGIYRSENLPHPFWSRAGRKSTCTIELDIDPARIEQAELHVVTWDGGAGTIKDYFTLNGQALAVAGSGKHDVIYSRLPLDPKLLRQGDNRVELLSDTEHHGIEVLMPGPALVVRSKR